MVDLTILKDEELMTFLEEIPENDLKRIFTNNTKIAQKIRGFRPNKAPIKMLIQTSFNLIRKEKNDTFIRFISNIYDVCLYGIKEDEEKLVESGYPESMAHSTAILKNCNEKFFPIYCKLEGLNDDEIEKIKKDNEMVKLIFGIARQQTCDILANSLNGVANESNKNYKDLTSKIDQMKDNFDAIKKDNSKNSKDIEKIDNKIDELQDNFVTNDALNSKISEVENKNNKYVNDSIKKLADSDSIKEINKEINELRKKLESKEKEPKKIALENILLRSVKSDEYDDADDYMSDNIMDVIENVANKEELNVLREFLLEIAYSNKPIICSSSNAEMLTNIISSYITGGNYYVLRLSNDCSDAELISKLESLPSIKNNKVVLIKNKIGVSDPAFILDYIKNRPFNEKYIFEIMFDKEAYFMPIEYLDLFNFFFGKFKSNILKTEYKYVYDFTNDKPNPINDSKYNKELEGLDVNLSNQEIFNKDFSGLLAYSVIPFIAINREVDPNDLIDKLQDDKVRENCEVVIHD